MQLAKCVRALFTGLGADVDQRGLVGTPLEMAIDRVVAQIGRPSGKPARKRRVAVVADLLRRGLPVNQLGLFGLKLIALLNGTAVKLSVARHPRSPRVLCETQTEFIIMDDEALLEADVDPL
jgi:hypothetical protein